MRNLPPRPKHIPIPEDENYNDKTDKEYATRPTSRISWEDNLMDSARSQSRKRPTPQPRRVDVRDQQPSPALFSEAAEEEAAQFLRSSSNEHTPQKSTPETNKTWEEIINEETKFPRSSSKTGRKNRHARSKQANISYEETPNEPQKPLRLGKRSVLAIIFGILAIVSLVITFMLDFSKPDRDIQGVIEPAQTATGVVVSKEYDPDYCPSQQFVLPINQDERSRANDDNEVCLDSPFLLILDNEAVVSVEEPVWETIQIDDQYAFDQALHDSAGANVRNTVIDIENPIYKRVGVGIAVLFLGLSLLSWVYFRGTEDRD